MSNAVKTSIWFTMCNFLQKGTAFIFVPIFTRLLTTKQYGLYNVYLSWFEIFVLITSLKLPYEGLNNGLIRHEDDKDGYASSISVLMFVMTIGWFLLYLLVHKAVDRFTGLSAFVMFFMFVEVLFNPPLYLWTNRERFDFRYRWPVVVTIVYTILNPVIAVLAVTHTVYKAEARIIATASLQGIFGFILFFYLIAKGKRLFVKEYWKFAISFNLPLIFYYLSQSLLNQSDRIMINYFSGTGDAGIYSVAYSAATIILLFVSAVNGSFNPWMYKKLKAREYGEIRKVSLQICGFVLALTAMMSLFAPLLIRILATKAYYHAIYVIPPVSASVFFTFMYMLFANVEMYFDENKSVAAISIIASVMNVILNAIFIKRYGYLAAGWTTVVCYMMLALMHYGVMKKAVDHHGVKEQIFDTRGLVIMSGLLMVVTLFMLYIYQFIS